MRNRGEIRNRIIRHARHQAGRDHMRIGMDHDGIAIRRCLGGSFRPDQPCRTAGAVFDHHVLPEHLACRIGRQPRHHIRRSPRREGHNHAHRPFRPPGPLSAGGCNGRCGKRERQSGATIKLHDLVSFPDLILPWPRAYTDFPPRRHGSSAALGLCLRARKDRYHENRR